MRQTRIAAMLVISLAAVTLPAAAQQPVSTLHPLTSAAGNSAADQTGGLTPDRPGDRPLFTGSQEATLAQEQEAAGPPRHTGFQALIRTTGADFAAFPRRRSTWVILAIGAGTAGLAHPADRTLNTHLVGSRAMGRFFAPGKWIGSVPVQLGTSVGLYVIGRYVLPTTESQPKTNKWSHIGFDLLRGQIVSQAFVQGIKVAAHRDRPTGECCAFPSGHAAAAFTTAAILERHLGYRAAWPTLAVATYVAMSRLHDNRHFVSDVLFGAALGTATGWTVVGRHGRSEYALVPVPVRGGLALAFTRMGPARGRDELFRHLNGPAKPGR